MERRPASHTEEEELNQRRRLLNQARRGDLKAINKLFDLYQVRVYSGDNLKKVGKGSFVPPKVKGTAREGGQATKGKKTPSKSTSIKKPSQKVSVKKSSAQSKKKSSAGKNSKPTKHR